MKKAMRILVAWLVCALGLAFCAVTALARVGLPQDPALSNATAGAAQEAQKPGAEPGQTIPAPPEQPEPPRPRNPHDMFIIIHDAPPAKKAKTVR